MVEKTNPPQGCLDILAQHLVSMAAFKSYEVDDVMRLLPRAWRVSYTNSSSASPTFTPSSVRTVYMPLSGMVPPEETASIRL